jgi:predicted ester cyclase
MAGVQPCGSHAPPEEVIMKSPLVLALIVVLMALTAGCQDRQALAELEAIKAQAEVEEQNEGIVQESIRAIDAQDFEGLRNLWAENFSCHFLNMPEAFGREETIEYIQEFYSSFPNNTHDIHKIIADGDFVAVMMTNTANHQADFAGIAATGNEVSFAGVHLARISNGTVAEWWALDDNLGFMQQLGMELRPASGD